MSERPKCTNPYLPEGCELQDQWGDVWVLVSGTFEPVETWALVSPSVGMCIPSGGCEV
jgi:hypothetical protein